MKKFFRLKGSVQNYAWGKPGSESTVAELVSASGADVDPSKPYAELWMGTHANGPATVFQDSNLTLQHVLKNNPSFISTNLEEASANSNGELPYLFKILSVNQALSIQAHPNKKHAEQLHKEFPNIYKDPNHKPEMTLALTEFEALVGFQRYDLISKNIEGVPELKEILRETGVFALDSGNYVESEQSMKVVFGALMNADSDLVKKQLLKLISRLSEEYAARIEVYLPDVWNEIPKKEIADRLALRLVKTYPGDVGVLCVYFLNYKCLKPGEGVFLSANEPHAYLQGDCAEIMATSDNVVRAGLTPKLRDVKTLCTMLNYASFDVEANVLKGRAVGRFSTSFSPPDPAVDEFELEKTEVPPHEMFELVKPKFACILIILEGNADFTCDGNSISASKGFIFFQAAGSAVKVQNSHSKRLLMFLRATKKGSFS